MQRELTIVCHEVSPYSGSSGFAPTEQDRYTISQTMLHKVASIVSKQESYSKVTITLDDGGLTNIAAADVLEKHGLRGVFFIPTLKIDQPGFLGKSQLIDLHKRGHLIGSHSHSHPHVFRSLTRAQMTTEWTKSRCILEDILSDSVTTASVPGGDMNKETIFTCLEAGYRELMTSEPRTLPTQLKGLKVVGRVCLKGDTKFKDIERWVAGGWQAIFPEATSRSIKNVLRTTGGPVYRKYVDIRTANKGGVD